VDPRVGLDDLLTPPGLELRPLSRPARSQSLYRLHYLLQKVANISEEYANSMSPLRIEAEGFCEALIPTYQTFPQMSLYYAVLVAVGRIFPSLYKLQRCLILMQMVHIFTTVLSLRDIEEVRLGVSMGAKYHRALTPSQKMGRDDEGWSWRRGKQGRTLFLPYALSLGCLPPPSSPYDLDRPQPLPSRRRNSSVDIPTG
jgi:hypothetical protein